MSPPPERATAVVGEDGAGVRLDVYLATLISDTSRAQLQSLVAGGDVRLNGRAAKSGQRLRAGDTLSYPTLVPRLQSTPEPENIPLDVAYEDEDVVVIDKPAGLVVHPAPGHPTGTLVHALLARYPELREQGGERPGIVHRLDRDTSGLMLVARSASALRYLQDELRERRVLKEYSLLCCGALSPPAGSIDAPVGRDPRNPLRMAVVSTGRAALTEYETVSTAHGYTLALARLHTGRSHQLRVHFAAIGHPLAGDATYGSCTLPCLERQFLHASRLGVALLGGGWREWSSPLPQDLLCALETTDIRPVDARP